jgi:hypothetical protein
VKSHLHYRTCIVRAWREPGAAGAESTWRLVLEVPASGARYGFNDFQDLVDTLHRHLAVDEGEGSASQHGGEANDAPR